MVAKVIDSFLYKMLAAIFTEDDICGFGVKTSVSTKKNTPIFCTFQFMETWKIVFSPFFLIFHFVKKCKIEKVQQKSGPHNFL